ncbi:MAG: DivIVA domain-containing protein [Clostridiales bacterium]|jgi:cell division septum initiation protein DivIVA|nr:DivIVA domain-containing protein [Clostridiales bacterium]
MAGFSLKKRGYDTREVDEYIARNNAALDDKLKEQKLRINELKAQNLKLAAKIKELKNREDDVKNALIAANEKSNEIISAIKIKYALEGQRLRLLQAKWTSYFENSLKDGGNDDYKKNQAYYIKIETELQEILKSDFGIITENNKPTLNDEILSQYKSETKRLFDGDGDKDAYNQIIKKIKSEFSAADESALDEPGDDADSLDLDDGGKSSYRDFSNLAAIKPEQSLEELCKELGL